MAGDSFPTLTFGVCTVTPTEADSPRALFEQADAALYQAKRAKTGVTAVPPADEAVATRPLSAP
jgi:PleD family two-component response regulator